MIYTVHECDLTMQDGVITPSNMSKRHVFENDNLGIAIGFASDHAAQTKKHFVVYQKCHDYYRDWY